MSETKADYEAQQQQEKQKLLKFKRQLAGYKTSKRRTYVSDDERMGRLINFAADTFPTPRERERYALPILLKTLNNGHARFHRESVLLRALSQWGLEDSPSANNRVINDIANHHTSGLHDFRREIGRLAETALPANKQHIVFYRAVSQYISFGYGGNIRHDHQIEETAQTLAHMAGEYIAKDRYPKAYDSLKTRCFHALSSPRGRFSKERSFDFDELLSAATLLKEFASLIPLNKRKKERVFDDIAAWLNNTEESFPGVEISEGFRSFSETTKHLKAAFLYDAKTELCPERLDEKDYTQYLEYLIKTNSLQSQEKPLSLTIAARNCLPEDQRDERLFQDLSALIRHEIENNTMTAKQAVDSIERCLGPCDKTLHLEIFQEIESLLNESSVNGSVDDEHLFAELSAASNRFLTTEQRVKWLENLTSQPFITQEMKEKATPIPFLNFLKTEFTKVSRETGQEDLPILTQNVTASLIGGELIMAFSSAAIEPENSLALVFINNDEGLQSTENCRKSIGAISSPPSTRTENLKRFDDLIQPFVSNG